MRAVPRALAHVREVPGRQAPLVSCAPPRPPRCQRPQRRRAPRPRPPSTPCRQAGAAPAQQSQQADHARTGAAGHCEQHAAGETGRPLLAMGSSGSGRIPVTSNSEYAALNMRRSCSPHDFHAFCLRDSGSSSTGASANSSSGLGPPCPSVWRVFSTRASFQAYRHIFEHQPRAVRCIMSWLATMGCASSGTGRQAVVDRQVQNEAQ